MGNIKAFKYTIDMDGDVYIYMNNKAVYLNELNIIEIDEINELIYIVQ